MLNAAIRTENLTCEFGTLRAVDAVSLEVPAGTVFGFLGPNGAGKTTTIRLLLGLLSPSGGKAEVLGFDTLSQADAIRQNAGALLEHSGLYERLSAEENLEFYARVWHPSSTERQARIQELLTHLKLWERRGEPVRNWSRGMRQKLAVARALLQLNGKAETAPLIRLLVSAGAEIEEVRKGDASLEEAFLKLVEEEE